MTVHILSRPIRSGKTTELKAWCAGKTDVGGILMPDYDGKRHFEDIRTGVRWPIDFIDPDHTYYDGQTFDLGHFRFSNQAFRMARLTLGMTSTEWLVIDEIGKLELKGEGFGPQLERLLRIRKYGPGNLLLVVREDRLDEVKARFRLKNALVVPNLAGL